MGFFGRERSSRGRDPGVPSRSSRKLRLDRDSDADVHLHPSSRQARLLKAQQGGSRRSGIAAHSSRNMSRAARAEEKIRLLDGIGGPGGATYSPPETATPSSLAKRARDAAPSFARVALLLALVAAVFVIAARPDIITAGRILAADALARALAGRADAPVAARAREAVPEATVPGPRPRRGRRRASRDQPRTTPASSTHHPRDGPLAPFAERCVRLTADGVGLGAEMLSLVHAARHFRSEDKAVVWDYADGAATCGCAETSDEHVEKKKENVASSSNGSDRAVLSARGADAAAGMFENFSATTRRPRTSSRPFAPPSASPRPPRARARRRRTITVGFRCFPATRCTLRRGNARSWAARARTRRRDPSDERRARHRRRPRPRARWRACPRWRRRLRRRRERRRARGLVSRRVRRT